MRELPCPPSPSVLARPMIPEKTTAVEKETLIADYDDRLASYESPEQLKLSKTDPSTWP
jgi:hypothetical protein